MTKIEIQNHKLRIITSSCALTLNEMISNTRSWFSDMTKKE